MRMANRGLRNTWRASSASDSNEIGRVTGDQRPVVGEDYVIPVGPGSASDSDEIAKVTGDQRPVVCETCLLCWAASLPLRAK
jgi:hypothetical protein